MSAQKPVHDIRMGSIKAAIWANDTKNGTRHNVTVARLYKTENGEWRDSNSFGRDDLPVVKEVIDQAWKWIFAQGQQRPQDKAA